MFNIRSGHKERSEAAGLYKFRVIQWCRGPLNIYLQHVFSEKSLFHWNSACKYLFKKYSRRPPPIGDWIVALLVFHLFPLTHDALFVLVTSCSTHFKFQWTRFVDPIVCCYNVGPPSTTLAQHYNNTGPLGIVFAGIFLSIAIYFGSRPDTVNKKLWTAAAFNVMVFWPNTTLSESAPIFKLNISHATRYLQQRWLKARWL